MTEEATPSAEAPDKPNKPDTYARLLEQLRDDSETEPSTPHFEQVLRHIDRDRHRWTVVRIFVVASLLVASALAVASVFLHPIVPWICDNLTRQDMFHAVVLPVASLAIAGVALFGRSAGAAMLVRALLWSNLLLGGLATVAEPGVVPLVSVGGAICCGIGLLLLGERGLEPENYSGSFIPSAHREALTLIMILAVADAMTLVGWAQASRWYYPTPGAMGLLMLVGIAGLYHLRGWALLFNGAANVVIASLALAGALHLPTAVVAALCSTAALQLVLLVPIARSIRAGQAFEHPRLARFGRVASRLVVVAVMLGTVVAISTVSAPRIEQSCLR